MNAGEIMPTLNPRSPSACWSALARTKSPSAPVFLSVTCFSAMNKKMKITFFKSYDRNNINITMRRKKMRRMQE